MATKKVNFEVAKAIKTVEVRDPQGRLIAGGKPVGSKISVELSADSTKLKVDVKEDNPSPEPLPIAYLGVKTGMYVRPTRKGTVQFVMNLRNDMLDKVNISVMRKEFSEAAHVIYEFHKHGWNMTTGEMLCDDDDCVEQAA